MLSAERVTQTLDRTRTFSIQADGDESSGQAVGLQFARVILEQVSLRHVPEDQRGCDCDLSRARRTARATMRPG